jgi:hypothetical protein
VRNIGPSTNDPSPLSLWEKANHLSPLPVGERIKVRGAHKFSNFLLNDFYDSFYII